MRKLLIVVILLCCTMVLWAQKISFQGKLQENGIPVNGAKDFTFSIDVDGTVWTENHFSVEVVDGFYSLVLGSENELPDNLFVKTDSRLLNISIGSSTLSPVEIFAPISGYYFNYNGDGSSGHPALMAELDGDISGDWAAIEGKSTTEASINKGVLGLATGTGENFGVYGSAKGSGINKAVFGKAENGSENWAGWFDGDVKIGGALALDSSICGDLSVSGTLNAPATITSDLVIRKNENAGGAVWLGNQYWETPERSENRGAMVFRGNWNGSVADFITLEVDDKGFGSFGNIDLKAPVGQGNSPQTFFKVWAEKNHDPGDLSGWSGTLFLAGSNAPNIQLGGQPWENCDLGFFQVFTDKPDGNGWYQPAANIMAHTNGTNSWGVMDIFNNGESKILLDGENGEIHLAGTVNQNSDIRLKSEIMQLTNSLDNLSLIRGVSYRWKDKGANSKPQIGLIAQEVEKVYPEFVVTNKDGLKALNYSQMVAVLIEAVKELNKKVEKVEAQNQELKSELRQIKKTENQVSDLKAEMDVLKNQFNQLILSGTEVTSQITGR